MSNNRWKRARIRPHSRIARIRQLVVSGNYDYSEKVRILIEEGWFDEDDIERCIETGFVCKKEKDEQRISVDGKKYTILGRDCAGVAFYCVGKIMKGDGAKLFFVITAHDQKGS